MNEAVFSGASLAAIAAWLGLGLAAALPPGKLRRFLLFAGGRFVPVALCVLYIGLLAIQSGVITEGGFSDLASVRMLFADPGNMLAGWVHFLAFDLLVGRWIIDDTFAGERHRAPLLVALPATFMFGPLGLVLYLTARLLLRPGGPVTAVS